jgi:hypothetical protein
MLSNPVDYTIRNSIDATGRAVYGTKEIPQYYPDVSNVPAGATVRPELKSQFSGFNPGPPLDYFKGIPVYRIGTNDLHPYYAELGWKSYYDPALGYIVPTAIYDAVGNKINAAGSTFLDGLADMGPILMIAVFASLVAGPAIAAAFEGVSSAAAVEGAALLSEGSALVTEGTALAEAATVAQGAELFAEGASMIGESFAGAADIALGESIAGAAEIAAETAQGLIAETSATEAAFTGGELATDFNAGNATMFDDFIGDEFLDVGQFTDSFDASSYTDVFSDNLTDVPTDIFDNINTVDDAFPDSITESMDSFPDMSDAELDQFTDDLMEPIEQHEPTTLDEQFENQSVEQDWGDAPELTDEQLLEQQFSNASKDLSSLKPDQLKRVAQLRQQTGTKTGSGGSKTSYTQDASGLAKSLADVYMQYSRTATPAQTRTLAATTGLPPGVRLGSDGKLYRDNSATTGTGAGAASNSGLLWAALAAGALLIT